MTDDSIARWLGKDDSHLVCVNDVYVDSTHKLLPETLSAFREMQGAASEAGVDMQLVSSYRDFSRQLSIWNRKWRGELPLYDKEDNLLDASELNDEQKMHAILTWSALPGASRHHWGTDFDVYDRRAVEVSQHNFKLIRSEYLAGGPCYSLATWLDANAGKFGFSLPYHQYCGGVAPEPWHVSFKPIADNIVKQLNLDVLAGVLDQSDMEGKATVLKHLRDIFNRYTLNGQTA